MATVTSEEVLNALAESQGALLSSEAFPTVPAISVKSALDRLASRDMVTFKTFDREEFVLSEEAKGIVANGSHEAKVFEAVRQAVDGLKISDLPVSLIRGSS
jgi:phenylalanyl-tRNA synthetase alpha chain